MKEKKKKKTYESGERELVRVNISYPSAPEDYFAGGSRFDMYHKKLAEAYLSFAAGRLFRHARKKMPENPYGAVLRSMVAFENDEYVSVVCDALLTLDDPKPRTERTATVWSRESGTMLTVSSFFTEGALRLLHQKLGCDAKKCVFFLTNKGYGFTTDGENTTIIPYGSLSADDGKHEGLEKKCIKTSLQPS